MRASIVLLRAVAYASMADLLQLTRSSPFFARHACLASRNASRDALLDVRAVSSADIRADRHAVCADFTQVRITALRSFAAARAELVSAASTGLMSEALTTDATRKEEKNFFIARTEHKRIKVSRSYIPSPRPFVTGQALIRPADRFFLSDSSSRR